MDVYDLKKLKRKIWKEYFISIIFMVGGIFSLKYLPQFGSWIGIHEGISFVLSLGCFGLVFQSVADYEDKYIKNSKCYCNEKSKDYYKQHENTIDLDKEHEKTKSFSSLSNFFFKVAFGTLVVGLTSSVGLVLNYGFSNFVSFLVLSFLVFESGMISLSDYFQYKESIGIRIIDMKEKSDEQKKNEMNEEKSYQQGLEIYYNNTRSEINALNDFQCELLCYDFNEQKKDVKTRCRKLKR